VSAAVMRFDAREVQVRTRWTMAVSITVHALLLAWLILYHPPSAAQASITEITWLEPGDVGGEPSAGPSAAQPAPASEPGAATSHTADEHFRRTAASAEMEPVPQSDLTLDDRLNARLATLQSAATASPVNPTTSATPSGLWSAPSSVAGHGAGSGPLALHRGGGSGTGSALALTRLGTGGLGSGAALAPARAPQTTVAEPAREGNASARRELAGASLLGPVADRPILHSTLPAYPEWAKRDAVEGSVTLYFVVENVLVQKTAGFEDFDDNARTALRAWRFEPLREGRTGEQWGTITFHFRLRDAG
jgi:TonB family protein